VLLIDEDGRYDGSPYPTIRYITELEGYLKTTGQL
jgi:hypothetical protein